MADHHRIYSMSFASLYPHYVTKAENKGRTKAEVNKIICWLTGYSQKEFDTQLEKGIDFKNFFNQAPKINPSRRLITGVVCGIRVEDIKEPLMQEIRYLDKLIDELARGKAMEEILRSWIEMKLSQRLYIWLPCTLKFEPISSKMAKA